MKRLRELCTQHGALLVFDEVMTGFRVALGGAQSLYAQGDPRLRARPERVRQGHRRRHAAGGLRRHARRDGAARAARPGVPGRHACRATRWPRPAGWPRCARSSKPGFFEALARAHALAGRRPARRRARRPACRWCGDSEGGMFGFFFSRRRHAAAELRCRDGHRQGALQPLLPRACSSAACTSRRRCTRPASSAQRTARPTSRPPSPRPAQCFALTAAPMHIHILGICGTFMGGLAALAREAGHRVTGCDADVYPPMSDQLRALGIELIEGYGADQLALEARSVRGRQRGHARQPADGGHPRRRRALHQRPAVAGRPRAARPPRAGGGRHARQDDDHLDAGLDARSRPGCSRASWSAACR